MGIVPDNHALSWWFFPSRLRPILPLGPLKGLWGSWGLCPSPLEWLGSSLEGRSVWSRTVASWCADASGTSQAPQSVSVWGRSPKSAPQVPRWRPGGGENEYACVLGEWPFLGKIEIELYLLWRLVVVWLLGVWVLVIFVFITLLIIFNVFIIVFETCKKNMTRNF